MGFLNFLKGKIKQYNIQKEIYLTIELDADDKVFDDLKDFRKINIYELIEKYEDNGYANETPKKLEYLVREIKELEGNILVGNACYDLSDLTAINSLLAKSKLRIDKIFIRSKSRRKADLIEGQELYSNHNRWINFYPGQIEEVHYRKGINLREIKNYFEGTKTLVVEV